jgi:diguanylate cyclase (GGDEF)-like protein
MLGGGPLMFLTGILLAEHRSVGSVLTFSALTVVLSVIGVICRWRPERVPRVSWLLAPFFGVALVTSLNLATRDASTGAQLFYLWPVLYAANFLGRRDNFLVIASVSAGNAAVVFPILEANRAITDWTSLTVAMTLTTIVVASLASRNERLRGVLESQAYVDHLTGVANRRSFEAHLDQAVAWAHRTDRPVALLTLDVDYFKKINDTWGHGTGDQALRAVAAALRGITRGEDDVAGRLGGDEFVVLLRTDQAGALRAADELRALVADSGDLPCGPPGLSIGVAVLPHHAGTAGDLTAASDAALYEAKQGGRGRTGVARVPGERQGGEQATPTHAVVP